VDADPADTPARPDTSASATGTGDLYAVPPSEFVAARDQLAKRLRDEGRKDEAADVRKRRRPSVVAWALNQLSRREPDGLDDLVSLGRRLRDAQQAMLSGGGRDALRTAMAERRQLIDRLASTAGQWLVDDGVSNTAHRDELAAVLEAATVDEDVARMLQEGQLSTEPEVTAGLGGLVPGAPPPSGGAPDVGDDADSGLARAEAQAQARDDRRSAEKAAAAAGEATRVRLEKERAVRRLEGDLADARRALSAAERDDERLQRLANDARVRAEHSADGVRELREADGR
jgi:hypothetical protein